MQQITADVIGNKAPVDRRWFMVREWSGPVSVDTLPSETRGRLAGQRRLLEAAFRSPGRMSVGERRYGIPAGFPAVAENLPGGATRVEVNSLCVNSAARPVVSSAEASMDTGPIDRFDQNALVSNLYRQFFKETVSRLPIREKWPGPMAGTPTGLGMYDYDEDDPFHRVGQGRSRNIRGFDYGPRPRDSEHAGRDHPGQTCSQAHPGMGHDSFLVQMTGEEEERVRSHQGMSCSEAHGFVVHRVWVRYAKPEQYWRGLREKRHDQQLSEHYARMYR